MVYGCGISSLNERLCGIIFAETVEVQSFLSLAYSRDFTHSRLLTSFSSRRGRNALNIATTK